MEARLLSWWQQIKTHPVVSVLIAFVIALGVLVILGGYLLHWDWTGFNGNIKSGKTLWDWLQLLFIPVVLAVAGFWFNHRERRAAELRAENERKAAELRAQAEREIEQQRAKAEQEIASDNQREAALQAFINELSELLLHENLRESKPENEVRKIARVRTLSVLPRLDDDRKRSVLQFLYESGLIDKDKPIVDVSEADFSGAYLFIINLSDASLKGAKLRQATFLGADLRGADLSNAFLNQASLEDAKLCGANLSKADLSSAELDDADLSEANLSEAILIRATLERATLIEAKLKNAILRDSNLFEAMLGQVFNPLTGTQSIATDLTGADLSGANLTGADLSGANLTNAKVTPEQLIQVKSLKGATMPDGTIHP